MPICPKCEMEYSDASTNCPYCGSVSPTLSKELVISYSRNGDGAQIIVNGVNYGMLRHGCQMNINVPVGLCIIEVDSYGQYFVLKNRNNAEYIIKKSSNKIYVKIGTKQHLTYVEYIIDSIIG